MDRMNETDFQKDIIKLGHLHGWRIAHFRKSWSKDGQRCMTAVSADGKGFPDLCMVKRGRLLFAELKSDTGKMSPEQKEWMDALTCSMRCEYYLWKPDQWTEIQEVLTR